MLIYVHVPFCRCKCHYCAFYSEVEDEAAMAVYLSVLLAEIAWWGERLQRPIVESVFFGGGTPSLLSIKALYSVVEAIDNAFSLEPGFECSLEANPDSLLSPGYVRALYGLGINRLNVGVQSLSDISLALLGRPHSASQAQEAVSQARAAGFQNLGLDLIWGLPGQGVKQWMDELKVVTALSPEHLSCYSLTLEEGTPLAQECLAGNLKVPEDDEQSCMFLYGAEYLESQGYIHYEISNYARIGFMCRHNLGYWEGVDYLGLGPSAVSTLEGSRFEHLADLMAWVAVVADGSLGIETEKLTMSIQVRELIMLRLRTVHGLSLATYHALTGRSFLKVHARLVEALHQNGLVRIVCGYLCLTACGMLVYNIIVQHFFEAEAVFTDPILIRTQDRRKSLVLP
ncbi:Heme chaperone HemW [Desulfovibrionales bacterium]